MGNVNTSSSFFIFVHIAQVFINDNPACQRPLKIQRVIPNLFIGFNQQSVRSWKHLLKVYIASSMQLLIDACRLTD